VCAVAEETEESHWNRRRARVAGQQQLLLRMCIMMPSVVGSRQQAMNTELTTQDNKHLTTETAR